MGNGNEVEIVVTDKDRSGPGFGSSENKAKKFTDGVVAGARQASVGLAKLEAAMVRSREESDRLRASFEATGDGSLLKGIAKEERNLRRLNKWAQEFRKDTDEGAGGLTKMQRAVGALTSAANNAGTAAQAMMNPYIAGPLAAVAGLALIPAGAAAAGLALAGVGMGILGLGAMALKESTEVRSALGMLQKTAVETATRSAKPIEQNYIAALLKLRGTVHSLGPDLEDMFEGVAPHVDNLTSGIDQLARNAMPGLMNMVQGSHGIFDSLEGDLADLGGAVGNTMTMLGESGDGAVRGLSGAIDLLNIAIEGTGRLLLGLSKSFEFMTDTQVGRGVMHLMDQMAGTDERVKSLKHSTDELVPSTEMAAEAQKSLAAAAKEEADALQRTIDSLTQLGRLQLSSRDAERNYQEAIDESTEAIQRNGRTLDVNTEKGRNNQSALDAIARATQNKIDSDARAGHSMRSLAATQERGKAAFIAAATAMGMEARAAATLAASLFAIPNITRTVTIRERYIQDARARGGRVGGGEQAEAHGGIVGAATGGLHDGLRWVGEQGPELIDLPPGTMVHPAGTSRNMATGMTAGAGGMGNAQLVVSVAPGAHSALVRAFLEMLRFEVRTTGRGSVSTLLEGA